MPNWDNRQRKLYRHGNFSFIHVFPTDTAVNHQSISLPTTQEEARAGKSVPRALNINRHNVRTAAKDDIRTGLLCARERARQAKEEGGSNRRSGSGQAHRPQDGSGDHHLTSHRKSRPTLAFHINTQRVRHAEETPGQHRVLAVMYVAGAARPPIPSSRPNNTEYSMHTHRWLSREIEGQKTRPFRSSPEEVAENSFPLLW